ncbi:MAG: hypothetical protein NVS2B4_00270 [Ramlibacter sp.]
MSGVFVALGRAAVAAALSAIFLVATGAGRPARRDWPALAVTAAGVVFSFPLLTLIAMRHVEAIHASVLIGALPLATAGVGAWLHRQRPSAGFWACAGAEAMLVTGLALGRHGGGIALHPADLLLLTATGCAAVGYAVGGRLSQRMRAEHLICWALLLALPVTLPAALLSKPTDAVAASA